MTVQRALLKLFHHPLSAPVSLLTPLTYADRLRIRHPGDAKFALGPHIDGGSVERWEDPMYQKVYERILTGNWEEFDAWQIGVVSPFHANCMLTERSLESGSESEHVRRCWSCECLSPLTIAQSSSVRRVPSLPGMDIVVEHWAKRGDTSRLSFRARDDRLYSSASPLQVSALPSLLERNSQTIGQDNLARDYLTGLTSPLPTGS